MRNTVRSDGYQYFAAHQYGYRSGNLPRRAMLVLLDQDKAQFTRIARNHLMGGR
jgi:hypothetical protein